MSILVDDVNKHQVSFKPISVVLEEDLEDKHFYSLLKLWVQGEIPYNLLMRNYPSHDSSFLRRMLGYLIEHL